MRTSVLEIVEIASRVLWKPKKPIYEFGSRQVEGGGASDLRSFFKDREYFGLDVAAGPGVDIVVTPGGTGDNFAGTVLCLETLEHARFPRLLAEDAYRAMVYGGWALFTAPFAFQVHSKPDYWRFTKEGLNALLADAGFDHVFAFCSEPEHMPVTVGALAWSGEGRVEETEAFKAEIAKWAARNAHPLTPRKGDWVLLCPHDAAGWAYIADPRRVRDAGGIEFSVHWFGTCLECYDKNGFDISKFSRAGIHRGNA